MKRIIKHLYFYKILDNNFNVHSLRMNYERANGFEIFFFEAFCLGNVQPSSRVATIVFRKEFKSCVQKEKYR